MPNLFIAGVTGHRGSRLAEELIWGRHTVSGLVREGSENRLPQGCRPVPGNAWTAPRLVERLLAGDTTRNSRVFGIPVPPKPSSSARSI